MLAATLTFKFVYLIISSMIFFVMNRSKATRGVTILEIAANPLAVLSKIVVIFFLSSVNIHRASMLLSTSKSTLRNCILVFLNKKL